MRRSSPTIRTKTLRDFGLSLKTFTVSPEDAYRAVQYMTSFKAEIKRLDIRAMYGFLHASSKTIGTRDPEFLRAMYIGLFAYHGHTDIDFGQSIGLGLLKVFPDDIQVKEVFVQDHVVLKASLENVRTAQKILHDDLAKVWPKEKVSYSEAILQGTVLIHTRKMSDLDLAV